MKIKILSLIILCSFTIFHTNATQFVKGDGTSSTETFGYKIRDSVFDKKNGVFYTVFGNNSATMGTAFLSGDQGAFSISKSSVEPTKTIMKGIATNTIVKGFSFGKIALLENDTMLTPTIATIQFGYENVYDPTTDYTINTTQLDNSVYVISNDGATAIKSAQINDAAQASAKGAIEICANSDFIFVAVKPSGGQFGTVGSDSGIAAVKVDPETLSMDIKDATSGGSGNKARKIDLTSAGPFAATSDIVSITQNIISMNWNKFLNRLYIGLENVKTGSAILSMAVAQVADDGKITISKIISDPDSFDTSSAKYMVGGTKSTLGSDLLATTSLIRPMHTSTGLDYLIFNGGVDTTNTTAQVGNKVYALPLVMDNNAPENIGTIATNNLDATSKTFKTPATATTMLTTAAAASLVGTGDLPIENTKSVSDMTVIEDTVYISMDTVQDGNNEAGILYSQAQFDSTGKISHWTPWSKRLVTEDFFTELSSGQNLIRYFSLDALSGKVWAIDGVNVQTINTTNWTHGTKNPKLAQALTSAMSDGCYCVLDLDQSTPNIGSLITSRYGLFGGTSGTVCFAKTSYTQAAGTNKTQEMPDTFENGEENFLITSLPTNQPVKVLAYTKRNAANENFFLAGTNDGLYAFAAADADGTGLTAAAFGDLSNAQFVAGQWHKVDNINGAVTDIKSLGNSVYVLVHELSEGTIIDKVYRIPTGLTTVTALGTATNHNVIAQTSTNQLLNAPIFTSIELIYIADGKEQLVLATNNG
ncbi:hypothetical protein HN446_01650, partial [bacterium]|nr:hypothetical protein [bacterium]